MNPMILNHSWIDENFYRQGSFVVVDQGQSVLLLKGGVFAKTPNSPFKDSATIFCKDFFEDEFVFHHSDKYLKISLSELRSCLKEASDDLVVKEMSNNDDVFAQDFHDLKQKIPVEIKKVVLVTREDYRTNNPAQLIKHLIAKALGLNQGSAYGCWNNDHGIVGCTPETLFEMNQGTLVTEALAGTAKVGQEAELLNSQKDQTEHQYVIQDLSEKLTSLGFTLKIAPTETSRFSSIIHLKTKISAETRNTVSALTLCRTLSPTAALGGYPKQSAKDFLKSTQYNKLYPERFFGSVIGTEFEGSAGYVMIRNLQWRGEIFFIESGVGVVEASELAKELSEIRLKRQVVRDYYL